MQHDLHPGRELAVGRGPVETRGQRERLDPGGDVGGGVGVQGAAAALVPGVEGGEQLDHLRAAHLADDDPVRSHPQGLADQVVQRQRPGPLEVGGAGLERDDVRVRRRELGGVLDDDDPFGRRDQPEQGREDGGLAGAGAAGDEERRPRGDQRLQQPPHLGRGVPGREQVGQRERAPRREPQRDGRAGAGDRRQDRVQARAVGQPQVHARGGVVETAPAQRGQPLREPAHRLLVGQVDVRRLQAVAAVEEDTAGAVDQHVGHPGEGQERLQRPGAVHVAHQPRVHGEDGVVPDRPGTAQRLRDCVRAQRRRRGREVGAGPLDQRG